jgi:hypothetical protein
MIVSSENDDAFEAEAIKAFTFLEHDYGFHLARPATVQESPRDSYIVVKYRRCDFRVDVVWSDFELYLGVLVRLNNTNLKRHEKSVYLEPFIEFTSDGFLAPIVPQIYPGMSDGKIELAMRRRAQLFKHGYRKTLAAVAERLNQNMMQIENAPTEIIRQYHDWYQTHR